MTSISIAIVNWNAGTLLDRCIHSIVSNPPNCRYEVLVVDNASTDGSADRIRECFPTVNVIRNGSNLGFAGASNQAIRSTSGKYVLLLNPDTLITSGALQALIRFMESRTNVGAAGARLINQEGTLQNSIFPEPTVFRELWRLLHLDAVHPLASYRITRIDLDMPKAVDVVEGACLVVRRKALYQVGLLDEDYFMYSEEVDLCYRLRKAGWRIYWLPEAKVVHLGGQSTKQVRAAMFLQLYRSKLLYFRKHRGWMAAYMYKIILFVTAIPRLLLFGFAWFEKVPQRHRLLDLAGQYRRLLRALPGM